MQLVLMSFPANIYLFKVNNKDIEKTVQSHSGVFFLTLNIFQHFLGVSMFNFEQVNVSWVLDTVTLEESYYLNSFSANIPIYLIPSII